MKKKYKHVCDYVHILSLPSAWNPQDFHWMSTYRRLILHISMFFLLDLKLVQNLVCLIVFHVAENKRLRIRKNKTNKINKRLKKNSNVS